MCNGVVCSKAIFAGFDAYIEEFFALCFAIPSAGYEVIIFEGPGQGRALEDSHLPMSCTLPPYAFLQRMVWFG